MPVPAGPYSRNENSLRKAQDNDESWNIACASDTWCNLVDEYDVVIRNNLLLGTVLEPILLGDNNRIVAAGWFADTAVVRCDLAATVSSKLRL